MRRLGSLLVLSLALAARLAAQSDPRCIFQVDAVGNAGTLLETPEGTNYFAGGGVRLSCRGTRIRMRSDSVASYAGKVVEFIGKVHYEDSTMAMDADRGTYFREGDRWEARGRVIATNRKRGSRLTGPSVNYFPKVKSVRDSTEMVALERPTVEYQPEDSAKTKGEPYVIVADRMRFIGEDQLWAGGSVTITRSDLDAKSDSLRLDTGKGQSGTLLGGGPRIHGTGADSFALKGRRIDLELDGREIRRVLASDSAQAEQRDLVMTSDSIRLALTARKLTFVEAWGRRADAVSPRYAVRGDSLAIETPAQKLREIRAFRKGWVGAAPDSGSGERDWLAGDTVVARFRQVDSAGTEKTALAVLVATGQGRAFYRTKDGKKPGEPPGLAYSRATRIRLTMRRGPTDEVERVELRGAVDGLQLQPKSAGGGGTGERGGERPPPPGPGR